MSTTSSFYLQQAASCADAALTALLPNEREKCLRSQAAWQALASRLLRAESLRARLDAEKEQARVAEAGTIDAFGDG
jgi:hypothetical protein